MPYADPVKRREYHAAYSKQWDATHLERRREITQAHDEKRNGTPGRVKQKAEVRHRRHIRERVIVIEKYGGCCAFCGSTQYEHLTIDHIEKDGKDHRAEIQSQYRTIYDFLYRMEYRPDLYRVLCWNCHMAMTRYGVEPSGEVLHDIEWWRARGALRNRKVAR